MAKKSPMIKRLNHRVALCSAKDVVITEDGIITIAREEVFRTWAAIVPKQGQMFSKQGFTIVENRNRKTHEIIIRQRSDIAVSSAAWVYEERLRSQPRWYKVLENVEEIESGRFLVLKCRLVEKADDALPPVASDQKHEAPPMVAKPLPPGVRL